MPRDPANSRFLRQPALAGCVIIAAWLLCGHSIFTAEPPAPPKASTYAPAADLVNQVDFYLGRLTEAVANEAGYAEMKSRVDKDANTLAALGLVLGQHDEPNKYRDSAAAMIKASQALAEKANDFAAASAALDELKKATTSKADPQAWGDVAAVGELMKQVPVVNGSLKRSLDPARFKRQSGQVAEQAATLAAIAQAAMFDTSAVSDSADEEKWQRFCIEMRDAAGAINAAAHAADQPAAAAAARRLALSCDTCHAVFHQD